MSHNPNTVKSQDDLPTTNDGKRSSDVLLSTIEELERTKSELNYLQRLIMELYHTDNLETAMIKLVQQTQPKLF